MEQTAQQVAVMKVQNVLAGPPPETIRLSTRARASLIDIAQSLATVPNKFNVQIEYTAAELISTGMRLLKIAIADEPDSVIESLVKHKLSSKAQMSQEELYDIIDAAQESGALV